MVARAGLNANQMNSPHQNFALAATPIRTSSSPLTRTTSPTARLRASSTKSVTIRESTPFLQSGGIQKTQSHFYVVAVGKPTVFRVGPVFWRRRHTNNSQTVASFAQLFARGLPIPSRLISRRKSANRALITLPLTSADPAAKSSPHPRESATRSMHWFSSNNKGPRRSLCRPATTTR